ncbi:MAG: PD40 domain-containing protein [Calditrichia bacterium]|nr:PD40 domain-containing protein [Calditrichia bacterium]
MKLLKSFFIIVLIFVLVIGCGTGRKAEDYSGMSESEMEANERIADLMEKVEDEPNNMDWRYQLSEAYQEQGRDIEALRTIEEGVNFNPGNADLKYTFAELAVKVGDNRKAFQSYKEILQGIEGEQYLSRIAPKFVDTYQVTTILSTEKEEAFALYSNDGGKILYQMYDFDNWDIYEYNILTQENKRITTDPDDEENPVYSPSNNYIAFTSTKDDFRGVDYNQKLRDIYIKDMNSGLETNLTTNSSNDWKPQYSKDGKFIVFVSERDDLREVDLTELHSNIYIMESNGSFQLRLSTAEANDGGPSMVGSEGKPIYFDSNRNGNFGIFKMNSDGTEQKLVTTNLDFNDVSPCVSVDESKIAFFSDRDGNYEIYMMNSDGSNQQRLTSNPADDTNPIFSKDGRKVLFQSNRSGNYDIYEIDLDSPTSTPPIYEVISKIDEALSALN